VKIEE